MNKIKTVFAMVALLISVNCKAQQSFFQHSGSDTLTIFYNSSSDITLEKYADYFRVAAIDPISLLFHGQFTDYDMQGDIIFSGSFINGKLDGVSSYYYKNGNIKETGRFNKGVRDSIWTYYFPDKRIEKIITFNTGVPYINQVFESNGKQAIINGTGKYSGMILKNNGTKIKYKISGNLLDGELDGKWEIKGVTTETFEQGNFITGFDVLPYTEPRQISLENILGYYCHEELTLFQNNFFCKSCIDDVSYALYSVTSTMNNELYDSFLQKYSSLLDSLSIDFSVQLIEFKVNQDGTISDLQTMQSSKGCAQDMVLLLMKRFSWKPLQQESGTNGNHYLMLVKQGGKVYMPQPIIITNDSEANFMIKQMNKNNLFISK